MEKREIALRQIKASARHYNKRDFVCSITLSGAAEEILGRIAKKRTKTNALEQDILFTKDLNDFLSGRLDLNSKSKPSDKEIISQINRVKNELKHNDSGENIWIKADFEYEATMLFVKAVKNYFSCYNELPNDKIVKELFDNITL